MEGKSEKIGTMFHGDAVSSKNTDDVVNDSANAMLLDTANKKAAL